MIFKTLLPPNARNSELALEQVMSHAGDQLFDIRTVKNPDLCPVLILPWLAWEYAITYWEEDWTEEQKRSVIKNAAAVNKKRGTPWAVKQALAAVNRQIDLIEWFNETPRAAPYSFRLIVHGESVSEAELQKIITQACDAKNARSWMSGLHIKGPSVTGAVFIGGGVFVRQSVTIKAKRRDE